MLASYTVNCCFHLVHHASDASMNARMARRAERHGIVRVVRSSVSQSSNVVNVGFDKLMGVLAIRNFASISSALKGNALYSSKPFDLLGHALLLLWIENAEGSGFDRNAEVLGGSSSSPSQFVAVAQVMNRPFNWIVLATVRKAAIGFPFIEKYHTNRCTRRT
jgi:hypothetical protein